MRNLGFRTEGCTAADHDALSSVVEDAAQKAEASAERLAWRWVRQEAPPAAGELEANIDGIVRALAELTGDCAEDSQSLKCRADEALRGVGVLSGSSCAGLTAAACGAVAGDVVGILTRLRGSQYRQDLPAQAAARMEGFAEPVLPQLGSKGAAFDRWLHNGLRCLGRPRADGNVAIAPVIAVTHGPARPSAWLFAVAYTIVAVPAGAPFTLACTPENQARAPLHPSLTAEPSPPTDSESESGAEDAGAVVPLIDMHESQLEPEDNDLDGNDPLIAVAEQSEPVPNGPCATTSLSSAPQMAGGPGRKERAPSKTWPPVIGDVPCPVDWANTVRKLCPELDGALRRLNGSARPLRLGTPCAGFEAPVFALRGLGVTNFERAFAIDYAAHAERFGRDLDTALGSSNSDCHWFGREGDLLQRPLKDFPSVDLLIAGPPCPPWSRMGRRAGREDPRARVFWRVIDLVGDLASRQEPLQCFILENVEGILHYDAHHRRGIEEVLERLESSAPDFKLSTLRVNSKNYSLPQSRPRVYIVGVRRDRMLPNKSIFEPAKHTKSTYFPDWLVEKAPEHFHDVPDRLRTKKRKWDEHLDDKDRQARSFGKPRWGSANANIERDRDGKWSTAARKDALFGTITTTDRLWVWVRVWPKVGRGTAESPASAAFQRYLMPVEALAMQGFPTKDPVLHQALDGLNDKQVLLGAGNAMSVPVVGAILAEIFIKTAICDGGTAAEVLPRKCDPIPRHVEWNPASKANAISQTRNLAKRAPASPLDQVIIVEDSPPLVENAFPGCGCWCHLEHVSPLTGVQKIVHAKQCTLLLGRDPSRVPHEGLIAEPHRSDVVSRVHAVLHLRAPGERPQITDLGSLNGTLVVGRGQVPVNLAASQGAVDDDFSGMSLEHGDVIAFGVGLPVPDQEFAFLYRVSLPSGDA